MCRFITVAVRHKFTEVVNEVSTRADVSPLTPQHSHVPLSPLSFYHLPIHDPMTKNNSSTHSYCHYFPTSAKSAPQLDLVRCNPEGLSINMTKGSRELGRRREIFAEYLRIRTTKEEALEGKENMQTSDAWNTTMCLKMLAM